MDPCMTADRIYTDSQIYGLVQQTYDELPEGSPWRFSHALTLIVNEIGWNRTHVLDAYNRHKKQLPAKRTVMTWAPVTLGASTVIGWGSTDGRLYSPEGEEVTRIDFPGGHIEFTPSDEDD